MKRLAFADGAAVDAFLGDFSRGYNELRPHQALGGMTPAEAWYRIDAYHVPQPQTGVCFESDGHGLLAGF